MGFMGLMVMVDEGFRKIQLVTPIIFVQSLSARDNGKGMLRDAHEYTQQCLTKPMQGVMHYVADLDTRASHGL